MGKKQENRIESLGFQLCETHHELEPDDKKLRQECEQTEDAMFDREARIACLKSGNFVMPTKSIISAIFEQVIKKEQRERAKK